MNNKFFSPSVYRFALVLGHSPRRLHHLKIKYPSHYKRFIDATSFLGDENVTAQERCWYVTNNITHPVTCKTCRANKVPFNDRKKQPRTYCSNSCTSKDPDIKSKKETTFLEKYNLPSPFSDNDKIRQTIQEKYGVDNISKLEETKRKKEQTALKNHGVKHPITKFTTKEYTIKKHGVDNVSKLDSVKQKKRQTSLKNYNVTNPNYIRWSGTNILDHLNDFYWLYHQYIDLNKTAVQISEELGVNDTTIGKYLQKHEIMIKHTYGYSVKCIQWLESVAKSENITIQHANNIGEYTIPKTRIRVDGYCKQTNTIYEFHGDIFHGNPLIFEPDEKCHPWSELTAGELYARTIRRDKTIESYGYNLIVKWENDKRLVHQKLKQVNVE